MKKPKSNMELEENSRAYRSYRKRYCELYENLHCSFCKFHRSENRSKPSKSWKDFRYTQYKCK